MAGLDPLSPAVAAQQGDEGDNILVGGAPNDDLFGNGGDDILIGKGGSDTLDGGNGDDSLTGDFGIPGANGQANLPDDYAFDKDDGLDTILDFDPTCPACTSLAGFPPPGDKIVLFGGTADDIEQVIDDVRILKGGDAELRYGDTFIHLVGFPAGGVTADMFVVG
jgi:Ca2+-binding RTX toxin-like protein